MTYQFGNKRQVVQPRSRAVPLSRMPATEELLQDSFVAVDFETANRQSRASACQIALIKMVRDEVVERYSTLLKPPAGFDAFEFTYLHGISAADVADAPMWSDVAEAIDKFVDSLPVYAHNASFDASVWKDLDDFFGTKTLPKNFFCSYRTAKSLMPGLVNYKLPTVLAACNPSFHLNHHRADSDAEACALIVNALRHGAEGLK